MIACIEALNYKCLRHIRQDIGQFQVLVGPNASGKSTFLDVVSFLRDLLVEGPAFAVAERASHPNQFKELVWQGKGNRIELAVEMRIPDILSEPQNGKQPNSRQNVICRYEVAVGNSEDDPEPRVLAEALLLLPERSPIVRKQRALFPIVQEAPDTILLSARQSKSGWRTVLKKIEESGNDYFKSETTDWNTMFRLGPSKTALANLPEDEQKFRVAIWAKRLLMGGIETLALEGRAMRQPFARDKGDFLKFNGSNLASVVRKLKRKPESARFNAWIEHVKTALPDIESIRVNELPQDRTIYLTVVYRHGLRVPSWLVSDGTLRLLALTVLAYIEPLQATYLIEEPENGVHPQAMEAIFQSLSSTYGSQVLVATHSPVFLRLAAAEQILCFAKTPEGATDIVRGTEHPKLKDWQGGIELADLFADGVLG